MINFVKYGIALFTLLATFGVTPLVFADTVAQGKALSINRKKGNCLACHAIEDGPLPGTLGPPLVGMKQRFPKRADLKAQIWDSTQNNPNSMMPPFGKHRMLSDQEIEKVVDYIHSL